MKIALKICLGLLLLGFLWTGCSKNSPGETIQLYDQPLSVIKSHIQGKWQLQFGKGGICGTCVQHFDNSNWTFTADNKVIQSFKDSIVTEATILWYKDVAPSTIATDLKTDSTYVMKFYNKQNVPINLIVDGIYDDTLIIHDFGSDAMFYHLTKK